VLFSELLLWGWLHRYLAERRLANAVDLLGLAGGKRGSARTAESSERTAQILGKMASALDAQDPYTDGHSRRVALHAAMIARKLGLPREEIAKVRTAAAVHDIGKLRTPPEVLNKAGMLTAGEFEVVKRHVEDGAEIVSVMEAPEITATVRHHHERFDGHGYPDGLVGQQTPVAARIIAVADTFDALTSVRPYRPALPHKKALAIISGASGTQLDPVPVRAFLKCYSGRRWVLFWTLLGASPQRAFGAATGRHAGTTSLASAPTIAGPATVAAVVAAAVSGAGGDVRTRDVVQLAQRAPPQAIGGPNRASANRSARHPGARRRASSSASSASQPAGQAVSGISRAHQRSFGLVAGASGGVSSGRAKVDPERRRRSAVQTSRRPRRRPPVRVSPPHLPTRASPPPVPTHASPPPPKSVTPGPGVTPGPVVTTGPVVTSGPGGGAGGTSSSGTTGGSGSGSGGGGAPGPASKDACKNGGFVDFGFPNQGQCVAWVENNVLH
jgi:putative nucleotidyltransferase with HDIG domain